MLATNYKTSRSLLVALFLAVATGAAFSQKANGVAKDAFVLSGIRIGDDEDTVRRAAAENGFVVALQTTQSRLLIVSFVSPSDLKDPKQRSQDGEYILSSCKQCLQVSFTEFSKKVKRISRYVSEGDDSFLKSNLLRAVQNKFGSKFTASENMGNRYTYEWDINGKLLPTSANCGDRSYNFAPFCGVRVEASFLGPFEKDLKRGWSIDVFSYVLEREDELIRNENEDRAKGVVLEKARARGVPDLK